jgi:protease II
MLLDREEVVQPVKVGTRIFFRRRRVAQEQGCICVSHLDTGATQVLVDPAENGILSSALIHRVNEDGSLLAFAVARGGRDAKEIRFVDTDLGRILPDYLPVGRSRGIEFFPDKTGYYYSYDRAGQCAGEAHSIRSHRFGNNAESDRIVFSKPRSGLSKLILLGDEAHLGALYIYETNEGFKSDLYRTSRGDNAAWALMASGLQGSTSVMLRRGRIFLFRENENQRRYLECFVARWRRRSYCDSRR